MILSEMDNKIKKSEPARITIKTVAAHAGVSVAAVSKVLRNAYGVSDVLRSKVRASIEILDYRPSVAARGMRGQTFTIGVLLVEIANPFLPQIIDGVNDVFASSSYNAMLGVGQSNMKLESTLIESMIDYRMDGLVLVAPQLHGAQLARYAKQIPIVVIGHHEATATHFDTVNSDDQEGAAIAVRNLVERGISDIAMLGIELDDPLATNVETHRKIGYQNAMKKAGLAHKTRLLLMPYEHSKRPAAINTLLQQNKIPRGLFCWSDLDAVLIIDAAKRLGLRVPEDIAIIGYDNSNVAALASINLSSIDQSGKRLGSLAAERLISRINGRHIASHILVEPNLVARGSH
jgi:LacI family transcriptional regulator